MPRLLLLHLHAIGKRPAPPSIKRGICTLIALCVIKAERFAYVGNRPPGCGWFEALCERNKLGMGLLFLEWNEPIFVSGVIDEARRRIFICQIVINPTDYFGKRDLVFR